MRESSFKIGTIISPCSWSEQAIRSSIARLLAGHAKMFAAYLVAAKHLSIGREGLPAELIFAMEDQKKNVLRKDNSAAVLYSRRPYWIAEVPPRQALADRPRCFDVTLNT